MRLALGSLSVVALALLVSSLPACSAEQDPTGPSTTDEPGEAADGADALGVPITEVDETDTASRRVAAPLDVKALTDLVDVRGVGDAAWSRTHQPEPLAAEYGKALDRFDATGRAYRGHVSYINWETVVGSSCATFDSVYTPGKSYAFVSRKENLSQAMDRGFNLIGLSNNHARDCTSPDGETMTANEVATLADDAHAFHGVGLDREKKTAVKVVTVKAGTRDVRVAFGSIYLGSRRSCERAVCAADKRVLFENLRDARADLRIVAIHSMDAKTQDELVQAGVEFVKSYNGDIVYGSGPHVWKPVRVVRKENGKAGVVFESLGNFLHPNLAAQQKNYIGRALFQKDDLTLAQVQVLPIANTGSDVRYSSAALESLPMNLKLQPSEKGGFANVKK